MTPPKKSPEKMPAAAPVMLAREGEKTRPPPETGIAERIKEARQRQENGLSIEALSRLCKLVDPVGQGIAVQTLAKYEKGIGKPADGSTLRPPCAAHLTRYANKLQPFGQDLAMELQAENAKTA